MVSLTTDERPNLNAIEGRRHCPTLISTMDELGVPWNLHQRGRVYLNSADNNEDPTPFFKIDGEVDGETWRVEIGSRYTSALDGLMAGLKLKNLSHMIAKDKIPVSQNKNETTKTQQRKPKFKL